jgi:hypothetical protein
LIFAEKGKKYKKNPSEMRKQNSRFNPNAMGELKVYIGLGKLPQ